MKHRLFRYPAIAVALVIPVVSALVPVSAQADSQATLLPTDTRLVVFSFDEDNTYQILTRPKYVTNIQLSKDELFVNLMIGDPISWVADKSKFGNIFIRPKFPNTQTSATIVTNKRTYQLILKSSAEDGKWYQRVTWEYPKQLLPDDQDAFQAASNESLPAQIPTQPPVDRANQESKIQHSVSLENLNFEYEVKGRADFSPVQVFDDGKFTWIKMPSRLQDLPAFFVKNSADEIELVNYTIDGDYVVVQRLAPAVVLKLGKEEVTLINKKLQR